MGYLTDGRNVGDIPEGLEVDLVIGCDGPSAWMAIVPVEDVRELVAGHRRQFAELRARGEAVDIDFLNHIAQIAGEEAARAARAGDKVGTIGLITGGMAAELEARDLARRN